MYVAAAAGSEDLLDSAKAVELRTSMSGSLANPAAEKPQRSLADPVDVRPGETTDSGLVLAKPGSFERLTRSLA